MASRAVANEVMTSMRLDEIVEYRQVLNRSTAWATSTGAKTATVNVGYITIPSLSYPSIVNVSGMIRGVIDAGASWDVRLGYNTSSDPTSSGTSVPEFILQPCYLNNNGTGDLNISACMSGRFELAANTTAWVRLLLQRSSGTFTLGTATGDVLSYDRIERFPAA